jgi:hypothetical protein
MQLMEQELELVLVLMGELALMSEFVWSVQIKLSERGHLVDILVSIF